MTYPDLTNIVWCHELDGVIHAGDLYLGRTRVMTTLTDDEDGEWACFGQTVVTDTSVLRPWRDRKLVGRQVCPRCEEKVESESALMEDLA